MRTAVIAVGTELLGTDRLDTNSLSLASAVERFGLSIDRKAVLPDLREPMTREIEYVLQDHDLLLITGGLGPTEDDLTRDAVAAALNLKLELDPAILARIEERFARRGFRMPRVNERQAMIFPGHQILQNDRGTAPGFHLTVGVAGKPRHLWLFPGVPAELKWMIENYLEPWLKEQRTQERRRRIIHITGMAESAVEEELAPFYKKYSGEPVTILASHGEIQLHLVVRGTDEETAARIATMERELIEIFGDRIFGFDQDSIEIVVGRLLAARGETVATGESCTGGLLSSRLTDVSGSSAYFLGGAVAYSRQAKMNLLGVEAAVIEAEGEVSEGVARQMAAGARKKFAATWGIGVTGIAGPTGGTEAKPVGTVHIAVAGQKEVQHKKHQLVGSRELIKFWTTQLALDMLRRTVSG